MTDVTTIACCDHNNNILCSRPQLGVMRPEPAASSSLDGPGPASHGSQPLRRHSSHDHCAVKIVKLCDMK